ncbi:MAG: hypothetical protein MJ240_03040 [Kiritimatiellae bacterium]|nr:hypothetical protein [Kiritimatiellia bacterium]
MKIALFPAYAIMSAAAFCVRAAVVTNSETFVVSSPTTLLGVTNIYTHTTLPAQIDANLTLDNRSYVRFMGANTTGTSTAPVDTRPVINIGTTAADVTLTVKGNSLFAATYRNSKTPTAWVNAGIDPANNSSAAPSRIRVHLGTPDGAPGSTGRVKLDLKTAQSFGGSALGAFWAEWLYVNTSVKPNASGYIDFLDVASGVTADISFIDNLSDTPARILFSGGALLRNNATAHDAPLAVASGHELILEGKTGSYVEYTKQYANCNLTARRGGVVRFRGGEVRLRSRGNCVKPTDFNFQPWHLSAADNIVWEQTGQLYLMENCVLSLEDDDVLPHAANNGQVRFHRNTSSLGNPDYRNYCAIDIGSTVQHVNGLVSDEQAVPTIGVVTNDAYSTGVSTARGTLVFGEHDLSTTFNALCTPGVDVQKIGRGTLIVRNAFGESLDVRAGVAVFSEVCAFEALAVADGAIVCGEVRVNGTVEFAAGADASTLDLVLGAGAKVATPRAMTLNSLVVNGASVSAGVYEQADWLAEGSAPVTVVKDPSLIVSAAVWTGAGADDSVATEANWADASKVGFLSPVTAPEFATGGSQAVFPAALSSLGGLTFNSAGDFTLAGADASSVLALYGPLTLAGGEGTRTYRVDMPLRLFGETTAITVSAANVTLHLRDLSGLTAVNIMGEKLSDLPQDYATDGVVILENPRTIGDIDHTRGGGTVILRGEVGVPGEGGTYTLDYGRYRNGSNKDNGWVELGKTRVENVVFHKKLKIDGGGQVGGSTGTSRFLLFGGVTNVFNELVQERPSCSVRTEGGTVNVFKKGFANSSGSCEFTNENVAPNNATSTKPATLIFDGPVTTDSTSRQLSFSGSYTKAIFRSTGNYAKMYMSLYANVTLEFTVDDAFTNTDFYFVRAATVDLCGTHQKVRCLLSYGQSDQEPNYGTFTSVKPATLEVTGGGLSRAGCAWVTEGDSFHLGVTTNSTQQITGPVSLVKSGTGYLLMNRNGEVASTGDVTVEGGTLEFTARTGWPAAGSVTAEGTGNLVLGKADTFGPGVALHLTGSGTISMPAEAVMRVGALWLDATGRPAPSGIYGAVGDTGAKYTTPHILSGRVKVANLGTKLLLR